MQIFPSEIPVSQAVQDVSASNNGNSSILTTILVIGALLATVTGVTKWLYPNTIEDVEREIKCVDELTQENMDLECNVLGDSVWGFRERLFQESKVAWSIRNRMNVEPDRKDIVEWVVFRWDQMRDVKANYRSLINLKEELMTEIDERKRNLHTRHTPTVTMVFNDGLQVN